MKNTLLEQRIEEFLTEVPDASREEIQTFQKLVEDYFTGKMTPDEFKAKRLHLGTYGIRGQKDIQMMRIKIPAGEMTPERWECLADIAIAYSKNRGHLTTRQDMQFYWIPVAESPKIMAKVATTGMTTREACSNSVRNVTACPLTGVSPTEVFDVTAHALAVTRHFLRNPVSQKLPRKFKIALESCPEDHARTPIHDIGAVAAIQEQGGKKVLGFRVYAGGGLGPVPRQAVLIEPFTPVTEFLRTCEAIVRIHDRLGDRKNKATARLKFVVKRLGVEAFLKEVFAEREKLPNYPYPEMNITETAEKPAAKTQPKPVSGARPAYPRWLITNVLRQKQAGYSVVNVRLRLGDLSSEQMRALADITRRYTGGNSRVTIEQNVQLRWVRDADLEALHAELDGIGLGEAEADRLQDVISCPGAETCQLGIAASRGLARAVEDALQKANLKGDDVDPIKIKISGCPNSCGQHHIADIGFFGGSRSVNGHLAPHFQLMLGGMTTEGKAEFGEAVTKLPARRIPEAIVAIVGEYRKSRQSPQESFKAFVSRTGIDHWKKAMEPYGTLPAFEQNPALYRDWGAETDFSLGGMGPGECAS